MSFSTNEERKLAYFHALSKAMTNAQTMAVHQSKYKSAHSVRTSEVWADSVPYVTGSTDAEQEALTNDNIRFFEQVEIDVIFGSNNRSYAFVSGGTFKDVTFPPLERGQVTDGGVFIRPWISPVDVPEPTTNEPSNGYLLRLYRGDNATNGTPGSQISPATATWDVDYYAGIIYFPFGATPVDLGWGDVKASFFQYTGRFLEENLEDYIDSVYFDSGNTDLVFNQGQENEIIVDLSSLKVASGFTSLLSTDNSNMPAENTSFSSPLACTITLSSNIADSKVFVFVNGVQVRVGNQTTDDCYFSPDGIIKRAAGQEQAFDALYWNYNQLTEEPVAGYELSTGDRISFLNLTLG